MKRCFILNHYYRDLYLQLQDLTQDLKTIDEYHKEIEIIMIRANIVKDTEAIMTRFINGLNKDIANVVELQHYMEFEDMRHMATKVKRQIKRRGNVRPHINFDIFFISLKAKSEEIRDNPTEVLCAY